MNEPRNYPKGAAKRAELIDVALMVVAEKGMSGATVREVAAAAGLSKTGMLHHFPRKEDLFVEVLRRRDDLLTDRLAEIMGGNAGAIPEHLMETLRENAESPALVQLFTVLSAEASDPSHPAHEFFRDRYEQLQSVTIDVVTKMVDEGVLPRSVNAAKFSDLLVALQDGLQLSWLYRPSVDMADHIGYFFDLITTDHTLRTLAP
jgi:AcrR family transcriptional regulator